MLTVTGINLADEQEAEQLSLFAADQKNREKAESIERTLTIPEKVWWRRLTFGGNSKE
jgi:hypothetical protein